ncbi:hypothetical protein ACIA6D_43115, partial [Streptomyces cacaoi]
AGVLRGHRPHTAPAYRMSLGQRNRIRAQAGDPPRELNPLNMLRTVRIEAGRRHLDRDIVAAPWAEEREPGRR